jgi:hypothetical protein
MVSWCVQVQVNCNTFVCHPFCRLFEEIGAQTKCPQTQKVLFGYHVQITIGQILPPVIRLLTRKWLSDAHKDFARCHPAQTVRGLRLDSECSAADT